MSTDDPNLPESVQNPYSLPRTDPHAVHRSGPIPLPANQTRGMVNQAVVVGVLMAVHGAINCLAGAIAAFYAIFMPAIMAEAQQQQAAQGGAPMPENMGLYFAIGGTIYAVVLIGLGLLLIFAGVSVANYKRRTLAMIALMSGLVTLFTCYCFPTSFLLGIYGMIFLLNQPVAFAFDLRGKGYSVQDIQKSFLSLP
jgi:hypothetical protein